MTEVESFWGATGLILVDNTPRAGATAPVLIASIGFAPGNALPRLRTLSFGPLSESSALLFCLTVTGDHARFQDKRILHKALAQLRFRGVEEVYGVARPGPVSDDPTACRFFEAGFLAANGFQLVAENGELMLMRLDLRGLLSLVDKVETAVKRILHNEPAPSPAAWSQRGT